MAPFTTGKTLASQGNLFRLWQPVLQILLGWLKQKWQSPAECVGIGELKLVSLDGLDVGQHGAENSGQVRHDTHRVGSGEIAERRQDVEVGLEVRLELGQESLHDFLHLKVNNHPSLSA